jgi:hypothetical protein
MLRVSIGRFGRHAWQSKEFDKRARGVAVICAMAGAVAIARALDDPKLSDATLRAARRLIENGQKRKPQSG